MISIFRGLVFGFSCFLLPVISHCQLRWQNIDSLFQPLPSSIHIFFTDTKIDTGSFRAYYIEADLHDRRLQFTVDTTLNRRLTPQQFFNRNDQPIVVVNCTFFSFETNRNLNTVIRNGKLIGYNLHSIAGRGRDTLTYRHALGSAIGISKKRQADVAWVYTDSSKHHAYALNGEVQPALKDSVAHLSFERVTGWVVPAGTSFSKWKMKTAVGGGPVLLYNGAIRITNNEELKFAGKAINDKHPRTAMGYTPDQRLIILVVQGRSESSGGASLVQEAEILKELGCREALNLDGGGSSCLLVNGKETIKPSDKEGQRPVPAVFMIKRQ